MANIKSLTNSSDKWTRRAAVAGPDYESGVRSPRRDWAEAALAAENNYKAGVVSAAQAGKFGRGVKAAGTARWQESALAKGPNRFSEGVILSKDRWEKGFAPSHEAITRLNLPPRGPKGSPQNLQRVTAVAQALRAVAERKGGA